MVFVVVLELQDIKINNDMRNLIFINYQYFINNF